MMGECLEKHCYKETATETETVTEIETARPETERERDLVQQPAALFCTEILDGFRK